MKRDLSLYTTGNFDRGASKLLEALWWIVRALIFLPPLPFPSAMKAQLLRLFGAKVGSGLVIRPGASISFPWRLTIGDHVWIGEDTLILSLAEVSIGSHSCVSQRAFLCTGSHDHRQRSFDLITKPIILESSSWVGAMAFIGPGVTVHEGAVCAGGSVVTKDVPPHSVVGGNPARTLHA